MDVTPQGTPQGTKKGMSKGCIIGIAVASVVILAILIGGYWIWSNKETILKQSAIYTINAVKNGLVEKPVDGVDTEQFSAVADAFVERLDKEEALDPEKIQTLALSIQGAAQNMEEPSAEIINDLMRGMIVYYPDLAEQFPDIVIPDDSISDDTGAGDSGTEEVGSDASDSETTNPDAYGADESADDY